MSTPPPTPEPSGDANGKAQPAQPRKHTRLEKWNVFFNFVLALMTVFLFWIAYEQWQQTKAARRPWVGEDPQGTMMEVDEVTLAAKLPFKNSGGSPALRTVIVSRSFIFKNPPATASEWSEHDIPSFNDCLNRANSQGSGVIAYPGMQFYYTGEGVKDIARDMDALKDKGKTLFNVGCIRYQDDLGTVHNTKFCFLFDHPKGNLRPVILNYCPIGNIAE